HYGCGGVEAVLEERNLGLSNQWLAHVRKVMDKHQVQLEPLKKKLRFNRLCELNVIEQVFNLSQTSILQGAWARQQRVSIHGWIYAIDDGLLRSLSISVANPKEAIPHCEAAAKNLAL